jgi:hypothetical protein
MISLSLPDELERRITAEACQLGKSTEERIIDALEGSIAPAQNLEPGFLTEGLSRLEAFIRSIPCVTWLSVSKADEPYWWLKFDIDIRSPVAWHVVQALGSVLNYLSIEERLPTVFMSVSPPPYLNGGPEQFLSWAIEAKIPFLDAGYIAEVLEGRLPQPVDNLEQWLSVDADGA